MKRALAAICLAVLAVSAAAGCWASRQVRKEVTEMPQPGQGLSDDGQGERDHGEEQPDQGEVLPAAVALEEVPRAQLPAEVKEWVAGLTRGVAPLQASKTFGQQTYLLVYAGEQRSGGYRVQFEKAEKRGVAVLVTARVEPPGGPATAEISYPFGVARIPRHDGTIAFAVRGPGSGRLPDQP